MMGKLTSRCMTPSEKPTNRSGENHEVEIPALKLIINPPLSRYPEDNRFISRQFKPEISGVTYSPGLLKEMKHILITTIAAVLLVGCSSYKNDKVDLNNSKSISF